MVTVDEVPKLFRRILLAIYAIVVLGGAALVFVVVDHHLGRGLAYGAMVTFVLVPVGCGVLLERLALRRGHEVHAEKTAVWVAPFWSVGLVVALGVGLGRYTSEALSPLPWPFRRPSPRPTAPKDEGFTVEVSVTTKTKTTSTQSAAPPTSSTPPSLPSVTPPVAGPNRFGAGDRAYAEEIPGCADLASIDAVQKAHAPGGIRPAAEGLARVRYPTGLPFLAAQDDKMLGTWFLHAPDTFEGVASRFEAAVHEGAHVWGAKRFDGATQTYPVRADLSIKTKRLTNFHWKEILDKHVDRAADTYAKIYLEGAAGAQGFHVLLDEYNAYTHSLAARYCTRDLVPAGSRVSARDGILTMMYYLETYLAIGRASHPADYAAILADPGHRKVILTVWDRAEHFLRKSADLPALGVKSETIEGWVYAEERLAEVARVRAVK